MPPPGGGTVQVERIVAVTADPDLERRVHDEVAPRAGGQLHLVGVRDVLKRRRAIAPRHGHLDDAALERAPAFLDHLAAELLEAVYALLQDHAFDRLADHVAAGEARALVEQVVHRRAGLLLAADQVPCGQLVVLPDLHAGNVDAVVEPVGGPDRDPARGRGADV
jgi:hypothetical protein